MNLQVDERQKKPYYKKFNYNTLEKINTNSNRVISIGKLFQSSIARQVRELHFIQYVGPP